MECLANCASRFRLLKDAVFQAAPKAPGWSLVLPFARGSFRALGMHALALGLSRRGSSVLLVTHWFLWLFGASCLRFKKMQRSYETWRMRGQTFVHFRSRTLLLLGFLVTLGLSAVPDPLLTKAYRCGHVRCLHHFHLLYWAVSGLG